MPEPYVCNFTNADWQMYTYDGIDDDDDADTLAKRVRSKHAGEALSRHLTTLVNAAQARLVAEPLLSEAKLAASVRDEMYKLMHKFAEDGANDTEPSCVLVEELEGAMGLDRESLDR